VTARTIILEESIAVEIKNVFHALKHELKKQCLMSSTHPLQLYSAWGRYIAFGHKMHHNGDLRLFFYIYSKNGVTVNSLICIIDGYCNIAEEIGFVIPFLGTVTADLPAVKSFSFLAV
jgi:hypothetical protein